MQIDLNLTHFQADALVIAHTYAVDDSRALRFIAADTERNTAQGIHPGEPLATATVHLDTPPPSDCIWVKDYSENEGMTKVLINAGLIEPSIQATQMPGHEPIFAHRLTPQGLALWASGKAPSKTLDEALLPPNLLKLAQNFANESRAFAWNIITFTVKDEGELQRFYVAVGDNASDTFALVETSCPNGRSNYNPEHHTRLMWGALDTGDFASQLNGTPRRLGFYLALAMAATDEHKLQIPQGEGLPLHPAEDPRLLNLTPVPF